MEVKSEMIEVLSEFLDDCETVAKKQVKDNKGEVLPFMAYGKITPNAEKPYSVELVPIPDFMMQEKSKDMLSMVMKLAAREKQSDFFVFVTGSWFYKSKENEVYKDLIEKYKEVRFIPGVQDCILLVGETAVTQIVRQSPFVKENGEYVFGEINETKVRQGDTDKGMRGRFANILFRQGIHPQKN